MLFLHYTYNLIITRSRILCKYIAQRIVLHAIFKRYKRPEQSATFTNLSTLQKETFMVVPSLDAPKTPHGVNHEVL